MNPFTRILAATDLSAPARHAAERAALISKEMAVPLELLHVANLAPLDRLRQLMGTGAAEMEERVLNTARLKLEDLAAALEQRFGVLPDLRVIAGSLLAALANEAAAADHLLVCGAKGESIIRHFVLGTTAMRMLSTATRPILVVKQPPREPYRRLLVAVDFSPASLRAIRDARRIAPQAHLVLLHAFDLPFEGKLRYASVDKDTINRYRIVARQEATQKLFALGDEAGLTPRNSTAVVLHGDPTLRVIEQEQEYDCDLIVMGKHGQNMVEEFLLGSVTKYVLNESQGDVLVSV